MSKAFTRESDDPDEDSSPPPPPRLPPGVTNFITPAGAQRLRDELAELTGKKRQLPAGGVQLPADSATSQRKIQTRIRHLQQILDSIIVSPPPATDRDKVRFGAMVRIRHANAGEIVYQIVGVEESDPDRDKISWLSPLARQLLNHRAGDRIRFRFPAGEEELEILGVSYEEAAE
jgi:transcription elongation factor GreB